MAERKATNKYYPPDFDANKHKSINNFHKSHPLSQRARKLHQGILIIRFELPYNIWCNGCNNHIGMGVRYNAEKSKVGRYYSTPIYKFRMKCHLCDNHFEIQTDPANLDYIILSGARRQENRWNPKDNEQIVPEEKATILKLSTDPMFKLEHKAEDKDRSKTLMPVIEKLEELQSRMKDDFTANQILRQSFRAKKRKETEENIKTKNLQLKSSLDIFLMPEHEEDVKLASLIKYNSSETHEEKRLEIREKIITESIFPQDNYKFTFKKQLTEIAKSIAFKKTEENHWGNMEQNKLGIVVNDNNTNASKKTVESLVPYFCDSD